MTNAVLVAPYGRIGGILALWLRRFLHAFAAGSETPGSEDGVLAAPAAAGTAPAETEPERRDLEALYRRYAGSLYWVCLKYVRNREDAEDMVNQVFVKVQQNLAGFEGRSGIYSWMYRIAVNECIQLFRKRKFETDVAGLPGFEDMLQVSPEGGLDARLMLERLSKETDPATLEIVFLLYLEGLTQEEVVVKLGISRTTVHRKITAFKARMERFK